MLVETSNGELLDKISILELKLMKLTDPVQLKNIEEERGLLLLAAKSFWHKPDIYDFYMQLMKVNEKLWGIEDAIRVKESKKEFDTEFIELARSVYFTNDERSAIKRAINNHTGSCLVEEKLYAKY